MTKWYETTDQGSPGVVASRIRLARNWSAYAFPGRLTDEQAEEMNRRLLSGFAHLDELDGKNYTFLSLREAGELEKRALRERRVINATIASQKAPAQLVLSEDETTGVVLNGTDHIRIQLFSAGLHLDELWARADKIDDYVNERFPYAFDEKYGYLTSFPTNVGTGMRASCILHLPAISAGKDFTGLLTEVGRFGASVKGVGGVGGDNHGALFEVSSQKTLGVSEEEILKLVTKVALQLTAQEIRARRFALDKNRLAREDEAYKSYGMLKYARKLILKDAMDLLSNLMTGFADGVIKAKEPCAVYGLMLGVQRANLQRLSNRPLGKAELETARAAYIRERLPELI